MNGGTEMDVREKLVELLAKYFDIGDSYSYNLTRVKSAFSCGTMGFDDFEEFDEETVADIADYLIANGVTVQEWINSEEMLPEFPCLAIDVNGNSVFIPDGILTIKDKHGEWCINASLAKEVRLIDGTKMDALIWENRIAYWMPIPQPPKGE